MGSFSLCKNYFARGSVLLSNPERPSRPPPRRGRHQGLAAALRQAARIALLRNARRALHSTSGGRPALASIHLGRAKHAEAEAVIGNARHRFSSRRRPSALDRRGPGAGDWLDPAFDRLVASFVNVMIHRDASRYGSDTAVNPEGALGALTVPRAHCHWPVACGSASRRCRWWGSRSLAARFFEASREARIALARPLLRQLIVQAPVLLVLPRLLGLDGLWGAGPIADAILPSPPDGEKPGVNAQAERRGCRAS